jgi:hypothetical protein
MRFQTIAVVILGLAIAACSSSVHPSATATRKPSNDPFAYCSAAGTVANPKTEGHWAGPDVPQVIADKLAQILSAPGGGALLATTVWRCDGGKVLACTVGANLNCGPANTNRDPTSAMVAWCADPSHTDMPASVSGHETIYAGTCQDGTPAIVRQFWTADARGFVKELWYEIAP